MAELKPCPFCGSLEYLDTTPELGRIRCSSCSVTMAWSDVAERYELIGDDIYRKIPRKTAWDVVLEHWNRRADNG